MSELKEMEPPTKKLKSDSEAPLSPKQEVVEDDRDFTQDVDMSAGEGFKVDGNKYTNYVSQSELEKLREFQVLDEVKSDDESNDEDSDSSDGKSEIPEEEIEKMLEEDLPEDFKGAPKPKQKPYITKQKVVLEEKGVNQFEVLPLDWMMARHYSGIPVYIHRSTRVCTLSKPYFLGKGNTRRHEIPISAIPCLAYRKALEEEEKQKEIDRQIEEQIRNGTWQQNVDKNANNANNLHNKSIANTLNIGNKPRCPYIHKNMQNDISKPSNEIRNNEKDNDAENPSEKYRNNNTILNEEENGNGDTNSGKHASTGISSQNHDATTESVDEKDKLTEKICINGDFTQIDANPDEKCNEILKSNDNDGEYRLTVDNNSEIDSINETAEINAISNDDTQPKIPKLETDDKLAQNEIIETESTSNNKDLIRNTEDIPQKPLESGNEADKLAENEANGTQMNETTLETSNTENSQVNNAQGMNETTSEISNTEASQGNSALGMNETASETSNTEDSQGNNAQGPNQQVPLNRQPVVLPGGIVMPPPRVETVSTSWKTQHLTAEQVNDYCKRLFKFKTINIMHFMSWAERRKYTKARKALQYPALPDGTKLITIPAHAHTIDNGGKASKRDWVMNMNGRSYLSVFHEYVKRALQKQPVYEFKALENASTPYQATVYIGGMQYGVGHGSSKRSAKSAAARASIHILIPEMRAELEHGDQPAPAEPDFSFFDYVGIEDPRITEFCAATCEPSPHAILRTCLLRNFGATDKQIHTEMKKLEYQKIELTMKVGKHSATVVCKNKKTAKQRASQAILQALHPHVRSWGSLLRLYGSRSVKSCKEKKLEEQQITLLQDAARRHEPNHAVLTKLRHEMTKLRERDEAVVPIGTLLVRDDLPTHSGSNLNNVDL